MISKLKSILTGVVLLLAMGSPLMLSSVANAAATTSNLCQGANGNLSGVGVGTGTNSCTGGSKAGTSVDNTIKLVLNLFSAIVGIIAVIMIIIGGIRYVTSGGSSEKTTSAKDTILFAVVGLIVVALAQIIVKFVLNKAAKV